MEKLRGYVEHPGKAVEMDETFEHVMAITLDPHADYKDGVIRCITSRSGDIATSGYIDRSVWHAVHGDSLDRFSIGEWLTIENQDEIVSQLSGEKLDFLGLEDPDIWIDEKIGLMHLYFTMPFHKMEKPWKFGETVFHPASCIFLCSPRGVSEPRRRRLI